MPSLRSGNSSPLDEAEHFAHNRKTSVASLRSAFDIIPESCSPSPEWRSVFPESATGWTKACIDQWIATSGTLSGRLFRAVTQGGEFEGDGITSQAVYLIVRGYAEQLGLPIAPHDLRRTFAQLAHRGHSPLEQIQLSLGHESILTTERYLGVRQSLTDAPCDRLGIEVKAD